MQDLTISFFQRALSWQDSSTNRDHFAEWISELPKTDLILLPEMFTTGFCMETTALAEEPDGESMQWMARMALSTQAVVTGSLIIREGLNYYNRLIWMRPDGSYESYDKRHLFRMAEEHHHFSEGKKRLIVELNGWHICPLICYDLRFPVWSRNDEAFHLLIYVANWPAARALHWQTLLKARAIENQCYVVGVNRIGQDGNNIEYSGNSMVLTPQGIELEDAASEPASLTCTLSAIDLKRYQEQFPAFLDADKFHVEIPG